MVEVGREGEAARHHIGGGEVDVERFGARCGLGIVAFDAADERLAVVEAEVGIER